MVRGRKPKPTAQKRLEGNPGKRPLNDREPRIPKAVLRCPRHLDAEARREWQRIAPLLKRAGVATAVDRAFLAGYCVAWSAFVSADRAVQQYGEVLMSDKTGQAYASPYINLRAMALKQLHRYGVELGIGASSRSRIHAEDDATQGGALREFGIVG